MAAFTFQPHFHLDSLFMSNNNYIINPIYFPSMQDSSVQIFENNVHQKIEPSMSDKTKQTNTTDNTPTSSIVVDLEGGDDHVINSQEKTNPSMEKKKRKNGSCLDSDIDQSKDGKQRSRPKRQKKSDIEVKVEQKIKDDKKEKKKDEAKAAIKDGDYVHVRARRGQASDSHSLAERVRREKISERLKMLQSLVPGCDKVNSKAHMLDEIINYVQSLQVQVEMLSMKLAYMNPVLYDFGMDLADGFFCHELQRPITSTLAAASSSPLPLTTAHQDSITPAPTTTNSTTETTEIANVITPTFSSTSNDTTLHENSVSFSTIQHQEVQQQKLNDFSQVLLQQQQQQEVPNNEDLLCYMDYYHHHHHRQEGATSLFFYE
ncbi:hypothetical protein MKX03_007245 [Papaver bracteatum]|nr:hypothetical protein MKX03_007245 [Papaver bracteatum]